MFRTALQQLKPSFLMLFWLTLLTGLCYPLAMTGLGKTLFPAQAGGSLILRDGAVAGSSILGQPFESGRYFQGRPSATSPSPDNASASSGSNLGPSNPALSEAVAQRVADLKAARGEASADRHSGTGTAAPAGPSVASNAPVPVEQAAVPAPPGVSGSPVPMDLVTTSASGLDPHISPQAALYQAARVAKARGLAVQSVQALIEKHTEGRLWGFWGEPRVNVLALNLALDALPGKE